MPEGLRGEWWIDDSGTATFADGDIGDQNHESIAFWSALGVDPDEAFSLGDILPNEEFSEEQVAGLLEMGADPKAVEFFSGGGGDARDFMMVERAWIRIADNNFQLWNLDDEALGRLRDFVNNEYPEDEDPLEDEFEIEELRKGGVHLSVFGADLLESGKSADALKYSAQRERTGMYNPPEFNEAFWKWFWDSKVVDENGDPLVVYHATTDDFSEFLPGGSKPVIQHWEHKGKRRTMIGSSGRPFWFATSPKDIPAAHHYSAGREGANIMPVYLSIRNPLIVDDATKEWAIDVFAEGHKDFPFLITEEAYRNLQNERYDGVFYYDAGKSFGNGLPSQIVALDARQIKSATGNRGTWDGKDPDITHNPRRRIATLRDLI